MTAASSRVLLYLDDIQVGQRFTSDTHAIDAPQIKAFAREFDPQPFHLDEDAAKGSFFGGLAASGWHTASVTMRLLVTGKTSLAGGLIGAAVELAWPQPTRPGDTLHVDSEVKAVAPSRSRPDRGIVTLESRTLNQRGDAVQVMTAKLLVYRKDAHSA